MGTTVSVFNLENFNFKVVVVARFHSFAPLNSLPVRHLETRGKNVHMKRGQGFSLENLNVTSKED